MHRLAHLGGDGNVRDRESSSGSSGLKCTVSRTSAAMALCRHIDSACWQCAGSGDSGIGDHGPPDPLGAVNGAAGANPDARLSLGHGVTTICGGGSIKFRSRAGGFVSVPTHDKLRWPAA